MFNRLKFTIGTALLLMLSASGAQAMEIAVIVNATGPLINANKADVMEIYLGDKKFEGGVKITPLLYPEGDVKEAFLKEAVKMTQKEYKLHWTKKVFQEGTSIPKTLEYPGDIVKTVRNDKGGIGFLPKEILKDISGLKVIMVIGTK